MLVKPILRRTPSPQGGGKEAPRRSGGANDNAPRNLPSNDNARQPPPVQKPPSMGRLARLAASILRRNPYIFALNLGLTILDYYRPGWAGKYLQSILLQQGFSAYTNCSGGGAVLHSFPPFSTCGPFSSSKAGWENGLGKLRNGFTQWIAAFYPNPVRGVLTNISISLAYSYTIPKAGNTYDQALQKAYKAYRGMAMSVMPAPTPDLWPITMNQNLVKPGQAPAFAPPVPLALNKYWRAPNRSVSYGPRPSPIGQVPNEWAVSISPSPKPTPAPSTHTLAPPNSTMPPNTPVREKEVKAKMTAGQAMAIKLVSSTTEGLDLMNAIYDAIPNQHRPRFGNTPYEKRNLTPSEKARAIYDNAGHIDMAKMAQNIAIENIEDKFYGSFGKLGGQASKRQGLLYGGGFNTVSKRFSDFSIKSFDTWS